MPQTNEPRMKFWSQLIGAPRPLVTTSIPTAEVNAIRITPHRGRERSFEHGEGGPLELRLDDLVHRVARRKLRAVGRQLFI